LTGLFGFVHGEYSMCTRWHGSADIRNRSNRMLTVTHFTDIRFKEAAR
jgi:hypothetical protein